MLSGRGLHLRPLEALRVRGFAELTRLGTQVPPDVSCRTAEGTMSRSSKLPVNAVSDDAVRALLERYRCPVPFHAVRARFLGNIASPILSASPLDTVKALWGGELPEFDSLDAANELLRILVMGLWNRLSRHQEEAHRSDWSASRSRRPGRAWPI